MGSSSSKFLADINFAKPTVSDIQQIMEYFHAQKQPGQEETVLNSAQARRFLAKLCKYQAIPTHRSAGFVEYLMTRLDKNKDDQLSFEELSDQELWKDVFKLVSDAKTDSDAVWSEKLKARPEEKASFATASFQSSFDTTFAAAINAPKASSSKPLSFSSEDHGAEALWNSLDSLGKDGSEPMCEYSNFVTTLAEIWDCSGDIAQKIATIFLPPTTIPGHGTSVIQKLDFIRFVRACGPWADGEKNNMIQFILRNFFEADHVTPRGLFHANVDEKKSRALLKNRGDFLYRYSSSVPDGINLTRFSTNVALNKDHVAEMIHNTRHGTWNYEGQIFTSLQELEASLKSKLLTPVLVGGVSVPPINMYSKSLVGSDIGSERASLPVGEKPIIMYSGSFGAEQPVSTQPKEAVSLNPGYAGDASFHAHAKKQEAAPTRDQYYAKGMGLAPAKK